ncbi:MAG: preprotein translocase subunit SecG [Omnitrophica WOR_2 bacterium RIFCSPHIGHO2_02_FULL_50_17]|nr:MAG: preprotein translocase subunit SecG [Omnitrophica WOR_2 bacterium RIFCSPHIGHO2_02_FULL_50_17]
MMTGFVIFVHAVVCIFLMLVILMQSGRGGGLTEGFASAESIFGARTNVFMIETTTVLATLFLVTCLSLAVLSSQKGKSLMAGQAGKKTPSVPGQQPVRELQPQTTQPPTPSVESTASAVSAPQTTQETPPAPTVEEPAQPAPGGSITEEEQKPGS